MVRSLDFFSVKGVFIFYFFISVRHWRQFVVSAAVVIWLLLLLYVFTVRGLGKKSKMFYTDYSRFGQVVTGRQSYPYD